MKIIENFLSKKNLEQIQRHILGDNFPWYYIAHVATARDNKSFYFIHKLIENRSQSSEWLTVFHPIMGKLNYSTFIRMRANLYTKKEKEIPDDFHVDISNSDDHTTGIFYVNTNNGYTLFKSGEKVESVENRLVLFEGTEQHCSVAQTDTKTRVVINVNFNK
jgi:hypothetical protein|tara:strand:- start:576 stop:1061 length:486 start_codon:yes stop_codon:yes gene_type:complete